MKKIIAFLCALCLLIACFASCGDNPPVESTPAESTAPSQYEMEKGELRVCIGMADENGKYVVSDAVTVIAESAFAGDPSLKEIVIGKNVELIASGAFQNCTSLKKVTFADGCAIEAIGSHAFANCTSLLSVELPASITRVEPYTFAGCSSLEEVGFPTVAEIGEYAFSNCSSLESVDVSSALATIDAWAFSGCIKLEDFDFAGTSLKKIGGYSFVNCAMLSELALPEGLETIGSLAFYGCNRVTSVTIPKSVKTVDFCAFTYTPWYQECREEYLVVGDGILIKCNVSPAMIDLSGKGIRAIGNSAFWNAEAAGEATDYGYHYASYLDAITIPEGIEEIGTSAFSGCAALKEVVLPSTVKVIGENAFNVFANGYTAPTNVIFSACTNLTKIGSYAFYGCEGIKALNIPASVESIGVYAFGGTTGYTAFLEEAKTKTEESERYLIVGDGVLLAAYIADGQTAVHIPEGVKTIAGSALCGWDYAMIPDSTEQLSVSGESKYRLSYAVKEVTLPSTLETIGAQAFFRMLSLESIVFPASVKTIEAEAFELCSALSAISGGTGIRSIGDSAFAYCTSLPGFQFSSNTEQIGSGIFVGCSALKNVVLPKGMAFPGSQLFSEDCVSLQSVYVSPAARARIYFVIGGIMQNMNIQYYIED